MEMSWRVGLLLALLVVKCCCFVAPPSAERLASLILDDPTKDPFQYLSTAERNAHWRSTTLPTLSSIHSTISKMEIMVPVCVHLIGDSHFPRKAQEQISALLDSVNIDPNYLPVFTDETESSSSESSESSHFFVALKRKYIFQVTSESDSLAHRLESVIKGYPGGSEKLIHVDFVDDIVREHHAKKTAAGVKCYSFYVLDLSRSHSFNYSYTLDPTPSSSSCGFTMFSGQEERYLWIDLAAGPVPYGPAHAGSGFTSPYTVPSSEDIVRRPLHVDLKKQRLAVDVSGFIARTARHLLTPGMWRYPAHKWRDIIVKVVMIHDHELEQDEKSKLFDFDAVEREIRSFPLLPEQSISFQRTDISLLENYHAHIAFRSSLRTQSNRLNPVSTPLTYLDSKKLHYWLSHFLDDLIVEDSTVFPVFLFDFSFSDIVLLDKKFSAVSFSDMVIAIQTKNSHSISDHMCNDSLLFLDLRDATRPVIASIIQSLWALPPTEEVFNASGGKLESDYAWAVGHTPFGPYSTSRHVAFHHRDNAVRNILLSKFNQTVSQLSMFLQLFQQYHKEMHEVLAPEDFMSFDTRINVLVWKLRESLTHMSLHHYDQAHHFLVSTSHDVSQVFIHLEKASQQIHTVLTCKSESQQHEETVSSPLATFASFSTLILVALLPVYFRDELVDWWRRRQLNKAAKRD